MRKKLFLPILLFVSLLVLSACDVQVPYGFIQEEASILEIQIVNISIMEDNVFTVDCLRSDVPIDLFMDDFLKLNCYQWFGDPTAVINEGETDIAVKIIYQNGEYEIINHNGQARYTQKRGFNFYAGWRVFDENSFRDLLNSYLTP